MAVNSNTKNTEQTDWIRSVHTFAEKWLEKFKDDNTNYIELVDHYFADDCSELGFEMDCGNAFSEKYGAAVNDSNALKQIIDTVDDIPLLGSAVYSQWRYFNHWDDLWEGSLEREERGGVGGARS